MLVIKKSIDLGNINDDYKDILLNFKSIPAKDLPELVKKEKAADKSPELVIPLYVSILQEYFIDGTQGSEKVTKDDVGQLDSAAVNYCYSALIGGLDPKDNSSLTSASTMMLNDPQK